MVKHIFTLALTFTIGIAYSQSFEGTTRWNYKVIRSDSAWLRQQEEAKKATADPQAQKEIKNLQEKMKNPLYKAWFESNPERKWQYELILKAMDGADLNSLMPNAVVMKFGKDGNCLVSFGGGMLNNVDILSLNGKVTYDINHISKTYKVEEVTGEQLIPKKIIPTREVMKIMGYTCTKYIIEASYDNKNITTVNYWVTTGMKDIDYRSFVDQWVGAKMKLGFKEVEGVPLKMDLSWPGVHISYEGIEFKRESIPDSIFVLPPTYKQSEFAVNPIK